MIRYFRYLFLALLAIALVSLAVANRAPVALRALPDDLAVLFGGNYEIQMPLFLVVFVGIAIGLVLGFAWEWAREHKHRAAAVSGSRAVAKLERELAVMKDAGSTPKDEILALLDGKKA
jgi:putative membrane protein